MTHEPTLIADFVRCDVFVGRIMEGPCCVCDVPWETHPVRHYYGDTCLGGHGELADIEAREAEQTHGRGDGAP